MSFNLWDSVFSNFLINFYLPYRTVFNFNFFCTFCKGKVFIACIDLLKEDEKWENRSMIAC